MSSQQTQIQTQNTHEAEIPILSASAVDLPRKKFDPALDREKARVRQEERLARLKSSTSDRTFKTIVSTPPLYLNGQVRARLGEATPRQAMKAKCEECVGFEDVKPRVGNCKSDTCPIWTFRPYQ